MKQKETCLSFFIGCACAPPLLVMQGLLLLIPFICCHFAELDLSPRRRSPRIASHNNLTAGSPSMDVFVFEATRDMKLSKTSVVLHGFARDCSLSEMKKRLQTMDGSSMVFIPSKGLFWLRKGSKQMVSLSSDEDLKCCIAEYTDTKGNVRAIRIACMSINFTSSSTDTGN